LIQIKTRPAAANNFVSASVTSADFGLRRGETPPEATIACVTRGTLAADGGHAILVTHGYTSGPRMIELGVASSERAWSTLVGPDAPIDTDKSFVVCSNMPGPGYGSTNAAWFDRWRLQPKLRRSAFFKCPAVAPAPW
jgi:homoserine O-acetyltransferase